MSFCQSSVKVVVMISAFIKGFTRGAKETPRAFYAPAIALWRLLADNTERLLATVEGSTAN